MATGTKALLLWCKHITEKYGEDVAVKNMTSSWKDGLAFCAILHHYRPDIIDFHSLSKENIFENNKLAFQVAEDELGIPALLDAEDMLAMKVPDRLSILTYISQYFNYFKDKVPGEVEKHRIPSKKRHNSEPLNESQAKRTNKDSNIKSVKQTQPNPCFICGKTVYLMERFTAEGKLFHRVCVKCTICGTQLKLSTYEYDKSVEKFFCDQHYKNRKELLKQRDEPEGQELAPEKKSLQNIVEDTPMEDVTNGTKSSPFKRNEPFTRKGIRPQSSPADLEWEKKNIIKSKQEEHQSPTKPRQGQLDK